MNSLAWKIEGLVDDLFTRLDMDADGHTNEEIIQVMKDMAYFDLADGYFNWCQDGDG